MATKFGYAAKAEIDVTATKEYVVSEITVNGVSPVLIVCPAIMTNLKYTNAVLKSQQTKVGRKNTKVKAETMAEMTENDKLLYPKHIIKGWRDVTDADGKIVAFTYEDCVDFISQLPVHVFENLREFCTNTATWSEDIDIEVAVKK